MPNRIRFGAFAALALLPFCAGPRGSALAAPPPAKDAGEIVESGAHFLVRLSQEMDTGRDRVNSQFEVKTIEPLQTSKGSVVRAGATIRGHISRIERAGLSGHARLWLTFDEIETRRGPRAIVAEVSSVPDEFSVKTGASKAGEIEARSNTGTDVLKATAGGAFQGSAAGVNAHNAKEAAEGAAAGGVEAFMASSGIGQEIDLPKGTKLELVLERPLYVSQ